MTGHASGTVESPGSRKFCRGVKSPAKNRSQTMPYRAEDPPVPLPMNGTNRFERRPLMSSISSVERPARAKAS